MIYRKCPESFSHESGTFYDLEQLIILWTSAGMISVTQSQSPKRVPVIILLEAQQQIVSPPQSALLYLWKM